MCKNWREKGSCRYGDKCLFAHGEHELSRRQSTENSETKEGATTPNNLARQDTASSKGDGAEVNRSIDPIQKQGSIVTDDAKSIDVRLLIKLYLVVEARQ